MSNNGQLKRSLGLVDATSLVISCVIGVGIFRTAASVAAHAQAPWVVLLAWVVGGALSFLGALCYAELGAAYPQAGGDYIYLSRAYGPCVGFLFGWTKILIERIGTITILGIVFADYLSRLVHYGPDVSRAVATAAILLLTGVNILGVHLGKNLQNFLAALKIAALLLIIGVGLFSGGAHWDYLSTSTVVRINAQSIQMFGMALVFVFWTYGGWEASAYVAEEVNDPARVLPWSILYGLLIITVLYLTVNMVYMLYVPLSQMPGKPLMAAEVMKQALGPWGEKGTSLMVACSALGALSAMVMTSSRILLAVGRDHALMKPMAAISEKTHTPVRALLFNGVGAVVLLWIGTFDQIVTYSTVAIAIFSSMAAFSVIVLRAKDPQTPRPYKVWGYPVTPVLFTGAMTLFIGNAALTSPKDAGIGFLLVLLGIPLYLFSRSLRK